MTVKSLIEHLKQCNPNREVHFFVDWDDRRPVDTLSRESSSSWDNFADVVMLGNDLPAEMYALDYKCGR